MKRGDMVRKRTAEPVKVLPYKYLHCPLFLHQKNTHACVDLRAKRICKINCRDFFEWAKENEETVKAVITKHEASIRRHLKQRGLPDDAELIKSVMPRGENICEHCGKAFKTEGRLKSHEKKKHKRQLHEKSEKISCGH
jgi:hypothetical protein